MFVLVRSGSGGILDEDSKAWGPYEDYDEAFDDMEKNIAEIASVLKITDDDEYGTNYDEGCGFVGRYAENLYEIFSL